MVLVGVWLDVEVGQRWWRKGKAFEWIWRGSGWDGLVNGSTWLVKVLCVVSSLLKKKRSAGKEAWMLAASCVRRMGSWCGVSGSQQRQQERGWRDRAGASTNYERANELSLAALSKKSREPQRESDRRWKRDRFLFPESIAKGSSGKSFEH